MGAYTDRVYFEYDFWFDALELKCDPWANLNNSIMGPFPYCSFTREGETPMLFYLLHTSDSFTLTIILWKVN